MPPQHGCPVEWLVEVDIKAGSACLQRRSGMVVLVRTGADDGNSELRAMLDGQDSAQDFRKAGPAIDNQWEVCGATGVKATIHFRECRSRATEKLFARFAGVRRPQEPKTNQDSKPRSMRRRLVTAGSFRWENATALEAEYAGRQPLAPASIQQVNDFVRRAPSHKHRAPARKYTAHGQQDENAAPLDENVHPQPACSQKYLMRHY